MCPIVPSQPTSKHQGGRPPVLDAVKKEVLVALVAVGCTRSQAARYLEVSPQTVSNTARRDPEFGCRLDRAEADLQWKHLRNVRTANGRSWRASAWALQRMLPEQFTTSKKPLPPSSLRTLQEVLAEEIADSDLRDRLFGRLKSLFDV